METVNTLWFGGRLRYLEQLSIVSAMAVGHAVNLFSYDPKSISGVPAGVSVRDAREVMADPRRTRLFDGKFKALGSDFFRYEIFAKEMGYWVDLDVIFLKPLIFDDSYVFGWENDESTSINGAILRLPNGPFLEELRSIPEENWCPPFFGPKQRVKYYWNRLTRGKVELEDLPWGVAGPGMITHLVKKFGLIEKVQPKEVFYPISYHDAAVIFEDVSVVEGRLSPNTAAIHMWNSRLRDLVNEPPRAGSYVADLCDRFGVTWS